MRAKRNIGIVAQFMHVIAWLLVSVVSVASNTTQSNSAKPSVNLGEEDLEITSLGEIRMVAGRRGIFRTYKSSDGTTGSIVFGQFRSLRDATRQTEEWLKLAKTITSQEKKKDQRGQLIGLRVVGIEQNVESKKEGFLIVVRNGLNCYLIQSVSLPIATQIENITQGE